jgi:alkylation response protein AidB-like acyl-CoA dehydrogenase
VRHAFLRDASSRPPGLDPARSQEHRFMTATTSASTASAPETPPPPPPSKAPPPGGGFLVAPVPREVFCREKIDEETLELVAAAEEFWQERVLTNIEEIETKANTTVDGVETPLGVALLREAGELGLLSLDIPEAYGGLGVDKITSFRVVEVFAGCASQAATNGAHAGIGTLPIVYFGSEDQKERYLERLGTAELVGCYALTEPGAGSDALSGRTTAKLSEDGTHYRISGEKIYITNGAWADLAIVFARLDGEYSAFIVGLHQEGVSRGLEEQKMGIHGSSTTTLAFDDVKVPLEDRLGASSWASPPWAAAST